MFLRPRLLLLPLLLLGSGCIADYRIQSPHVSMVLAQGHGPELYRQARQSRQEPIVARHDWGLFTRDQVNEAMAHAGEQHDVVLVVGEHLKNVFTYGAQRVLAGRNSRPGWLAYKVRIFSNVQDYEPTQ